MEMNENKKISFPLLGNWFYNHAVYFIYRLKHKRKSKYCFIIYSIVNWVYFTRRVWHLNDVCGLLIFLRLNPELKGFCQADPTEPRLARKQGGEKISGRQCGFICGVLINPATTLAPPSANGTRSASHAGAVSNVSNLSTVDFCFWTRT